MNEPTGFTKVVSHPAMPVPMAPEKLSRLASV